MSYTTERQPQGISKEAEHLLREGMIAELVAINDYSYFISLTENKEAKDILIDIMGDEKKHYGMFLEALRKTDKEQYTQFMDVREAIKISPKNKSSDHTNNKSKKNELLTHIRSAIKGELEAIILYTNIIEKLQDKKLVEIIEKIRYEEKEHTEELTRVLMLVDKDEYGPISE